MEYKRKRIKKLNYEPAQDDDDDDVDRKAWEMPLDVQTMLKGITETSEGAIVFEKDIERAKKDAIRTESDKILEKGVIRFLYVIIDMSAAMNMKDLKPTRFTVTLNLVEEFILEYFDQNPLSQLGIIVSYHKVATKITELSGNPKHQIETLKKECKTGGEMSLQNALKMAQTSLRDVPPYGCREILVIMGSLSTCDPGDIFDTIKSLKDDNVRCSVINIAAELHVCKVLAKATSGESSVPMHESHYQRLLQNYLTPKPIKRSQKVSRRWIQMGFPQKRSDTYPSLCACHNTFNYSGYFCPKCKTKYCEIPTDCKICGLTLVSSPHLARSYHHLFPVPSYKEAKPDTPSTQNCFSCLKTLDSEKSLFLTCLKCRKIFCVDCDKHVHENLHNCPGCLCCASVDDQYNKPQLQQQAHGQQVTMNLPSSTAFRSSNSSGFRRE